MSITTKRILVLFSVNVLMAVHLLAFYHFRAYGLGTISPQGGLDILVDGIITGSAIFTGVLVILTIAFGRLACGWLCHWAGFMECSHVLLKKAGIEAKPLHSRAGILRYAFLAMLIATPVTSYFGKGMPEIGDVQLGAVEVFTPDLPTGVVLVATVVVSAVVITGLFGSRAFCRYICPWSLILRFFDRISPTRIRQKKKCEACRTCTNECPMGIDVQKEIEAHGQVRSTECVRCLTCTSGCPSGVLSYSAKAGPFQPGGSFRTRLSDFGWATDLLFIVPAAILAPVAIFKLDSFQGWLGAAWGISIGYCALKVFTAREKRDRGIAAGGGLLLAAGVAWAVFTPTQVAAYNTGKYAARSGEFAEAEQLFRGALAMDPNGRLSYDILQELAALMVDEARWDEAEAVYQEQLALKPYYEPQVKYNMGQAYMRQARFAEAADSYRAVLRTRPKFADAHFNLAYCLRDLGQEQEATAELAEAIRLKPSLASMLQLPDAP